MISLYQNLQWHAGCQFCNLNLTTSALGLLQTIWFLGNPKKCREMTLRFHRVVDHLPSALAIDTTALESVDAHKVLGVTIQSNLKWDLHINAVVALVSKRLHILRILKRGGVPPANLLKVYFVLIRSVLEYCCPVWHYALPVKLSDSIEQVQQRALRIIFPAMNYQEALATTGCVSLHTRRMGLICVASYLQR